MTEDEPIQAAGGVVWRSSVSDGGADGGLEILLIHRPRYDDWTLPKGKAEPDDGDAAATALREVWEETGLRCRLGVDLGEIGYEVQGRPKVVRYWAMQVEDGQDESFLPNKEVDDVAWLAAADARARLVYLPDAEIVDRFLASWL
jgi:8-oxo-dGTP pyrophosphatase MutT (NUDIX family)